MSRPRSQFTHANRLVMEALEDRRVMTGLGLGASAVVELAIPAAAQIGVLEQAAQVSVVVDVATEAEATEALSKAEAHQLVVELHHEYQEARQELKEEYKEDRAELREAEHEARAEIRLDTPAARVEFNAAVSDARVELTQEYHEDLQDLREDYHEAREEIISRVDQTPSRGNDQNNRGSDNARSEVVVQEATPEVVRDASDNAPVQQGATNPDQPASQDNPAAPGAPQNDRIVPPDANQAVVSPDALPNHQHGPAVVQDGSVARATATGDELRTGPAATVAAAEVVSAGGSVGVSGEERYVPVALVIAGTESPSEEGLQGAGLAAGDSSFSVASLDAALQQIVQGADQIARSLTQNPSYLPWMLAVLAGGVGLELYRRKKKAVRPTLAAASLTANSTLSWVPGMPGSFSEEDA